MTRFLNFKKVLTAVAIGSLALVPELKAQTKLPVSLFNWSDYIGVNTIKNFEKEFGYKVNYDTYGSADAAEAKILSGNMGYDGVMTEALFLPRFIPLGLFAELDKSKLPNWKNVDPDLLKLLEKRDPGNKYMIPNFRSFTGITYDKDRMAQIMPNAPVDSIDFLFNPQIISKFKNCGVSILDSQQDVFAMASLYLKKDGNPMTVEDLKAAADAIYAIRKYIRAFDSANYLNAIANRELCVVMSWSGDFAVSQERAAKSGKKINYGFSIPKEGAMLTLDGWLISATAKNPAGVYEFLNFNLSGKIAADNVNTVKYGSTNLAALPFIDKALLANPATTPPPELMARAILFEDLPPKLLKVRSRMWQRLKANTYSPKQTY
ncbi:MAG: extracellular solute-binding protein [Candidatus Pacebacteria bacterium]|nr:extracellular solute-binding protein [Candidatus Paceibacterota bacterium]